MKKLKLKGDTVVVIQEKKREKGDISEVFINITEF